MFCAHFADQFLLLQTISFGHGFTLGLDFCILSKSAGTSLDYYMTGPLLVFACHMTLKQMDLIWDGLLTLLLV